jgi:hypothetical protein
MISIFDLKSIKITLTYPLLCSILINGCASYVPLTIEDKSEGTQLDNQDIAIILNDDTRIESKAYLHVLVKSPSDFVYGIGYYRNNPSHDFHGRLLSSLIDSSKNITIKGQTIESGGKSLLCWLKDGQTLIFREHNYQRITPADSIGFFRIGTPGIKNKIPLTSIKTFEVKVVNTLSTVLISIPIIYLVIALLATGIKFDPMGR